MTVVAERPVVVIGGGLAGIAAAVKLADAGCRAVVFESRKALGGRAGSFFDPRDGRLIDNCQHVVLGCCTNLIDLYDRLGVLEKIGWHDTLYFSDGRGEVDTLRASWLPAPFHLAPSFLRMGLLSRPQRRHVLRAMWRIIRLGTAGRLRWREQTFGEFLNHCRQPEEVIRKFWNVIVTSACNLGVQRVSAAAALKVIQEGFLGNRFSYRMGLATVPLAALYETARGLLEDAGGEVHLGTPAHAIAFDGTRVTGVITTGDRIDAAAVICAVPFDRLDTLTGSAMQHADARLGMPGRLEVSPILGVHLMFDQPVMSLPHLVLAEGDVQWLFNKGMVGDRQYIHAVISAADEWMGLDHNQIIERVMHDVHRALPESVGLQPVEARSIKERRATFAATPQAEASRPPVSPVHAGGSAIENLFLAGDFCDSGWPATMEGAVRSGYAAAAAITGTGGLVEDIPAGLAARWLGLR